MEDISNKTLAILVAIAIVVGIVGLFTISPTKIYQATGRAGTTQTGTTALNITNVVSITLTTSTVDFGSGYVNASSSYCDMDTYTFSSRVGCVGFTDPGSGFILENDGNVNVSVTANSTTASDFIGGTNPDYYFASGDSEAGSCTSGSVASYISFTASPQTVCSNLRYEDSSDEIVIHIGVTIPDDADVGARSTSVVFTATEV